MSDTIIGNLDGVRFNGSKTHRQPGILNLSFEGVDADSILLEMPDVAPFGGFGMHIRSSRTITRPDGQWVYQNFLRALRFALGIGRFNTAEEVQYVGRRCAEVVARLRAVSPKLAPK